jgi:hypothetical protein
MFAFNCYSLLGASRLTIRAYGAVNKFHGLVNMDINMKLQVKNAELAD